MKPSRSLLRLLSVIVLTTSFQVAEVPAYAGESGQEPLASVRAVRFHVEPGGRFERGLTESLAKGARSPPDRLHAYLSLSLRGFRFLPVSFRGRALRRTVRWH